MKAYFQIIWTWSVKSHFFVQSVGLVSKKLLPKFVIPVNKWYFSPVSGSSADVTEYTYPRVIEYMPIWSIDMHGQ